MAATDLNPDMVNFFIIAANRIEDHEIAFAKIVPACAGARRLPVLRAPLQVDADFGEDEFRERRAIENQLQRIASAEVVAYAALIAFGDLYGAVGFGA